MIYNYGLLWRRDLIYWGKGGKGDNSAHLWGMTSRSKKEPPSLKAEDLKTKAKNFRRQIGVYALYYEFELVYIGQTGRNAEKGEKKGKDLYTRLNEHRSDQLADRWTKFSWFGIRKVTADGLGTIKQGATPRTADILDTLEAVMISISEPKLNRRSGSWGPAREYFQWWSNEQLEDQKKRGISPGPGRTDVR